MYDIVILEHETFVLHHASGVPTVTHVNKHHVEMSHTSYACFVVDMLWRMQREWGQWQNLQVKGVKGVSKKMG